MTVPLRRARRWYARGVAQLLHRVANRAWSTAYRLDRVVEVLERER